MDTSRGGHRQPWPGRALTIFVHGQIGKTRHRRRTHDRPTRTHIRSGLVNSGALHRLFTKSSKVKPRKEQHIWFNGGSLKAVVVELSLGAYARLWASNAVDDKNNNLKRRPYIGCAITSRKPLNTKMSAGIPTRLTGSKSLGLQGPPRQRRRASRADGVKRASYASERK
ncbi:hypothetical protein EVAR_40881_1 [Eumeta japonica]|uniref:Uncharacterized protein n=1 Tax=Eumeta variegata TaxID=151549 RepID=A0A4C1X8N6_EUMVA|nr:hypothetical protein EVAR_40881_1 [Eumeta japonica]